MPVATQSMTKRNLRVVATPNTSTDLICHPCTPIQGTISTSLPIVYDSGPPSTILFQNFKISNFRNFALSSRPYSLVGSSHNFPVSNNSTMGSECDKSNLPPVKDESSSSQNNIMKMLSMIL